MRLPNRFSLATLLALTTLVAGSLAFWRAYIWEPPTHKIALYERAPGTKGRSIEVGPNRIGLWLLARNARDGSIQYDMQRSSGGKLSTADEQALKAAAPWLDIVQLELEPSPERIDIIEARVFDHQSRELITTLHNDYGWRVIAPDTIHIYGLGRPLPPKVDIWFRAKSYAPGDKVATLAATRGSSCPAGAGTITLDDIRPGSWFFDGKQFTASVGDQTHQVATVLEIAGPATNTRYQIAAVKKSGGKIHTDLPHFLQFYPGGPQLTPVRFNVQPDELSHFEVRPFGGRSTFFFEGVALPRPAKAPFGLPPVAKVNVAGKETSATLTDFAPVSVKVSLRDGLWASGIMAGNEWAAIMPRGDVKDRGDAFTLDYDGIGLGRLALTFNFIDAVTGKPIKEQDLKRRGSPNAYGANVGAGYNEYMIPLKNIGSVDITLGQ